SSFFLGLSTALLVALIGVAFSRMWMERFDFGPVEWLWRQATYGRRYPLRRQRHPGPGLSTAEEA
ncbi:MAG: DUF418 domain-containing protein, partial [Holophagales bacterium]|nr:DUF418 domain-containing protein [Holophagales bacterium]